MIRIKSNLLKKIESEKQMKAIEQGKRKYEMIIKLER